MAIEENITWVLSESWVLQLTCCDSSGQALDLTGADVQMRIGLCPNALTQTTLNGAQIIDAPNGVCAFQVTPDEQVGVFRPGVYEYEARAILSNGVITSQLKGYVSVEASPFAPPPTNVPPS